ncbi:hypothetical protein HAX54_012662 [Datura stramonium]|uniref:Uncharacterized protein n=1 Tax=Datura stramonium TaxID=4076 RepID=A0ABS8TLX9_DATST|nr:hypothetical protein [Datura stramonium]
MSHPMTQVENEDPQTTREQAKSKPMVPKATSISAPQSKEGEGEQWSELGNSSNKEVDSHDEESEEGSQKASDELTPPAKRYTIRWGVLGLEDIYEQGLFLTSKKNPKRSIQEEPRILIWVMNENKYLRRLLDLYDLG